MREDSSLRVILMMGASGSGKSTYVRQNFSDAWIVSADAIREELTGDSSNHTREDEVWHLVRKRIVRGIFKNKTVVVDNTNVTTAGRYNIYRLARRVFAKYVPIEVHVMQTHLGQCHKNNLARPGRTVPASIIDRQFEHFVMSLGTLASEGVDKIYLVPESKSNTVAC